MYAYGTTEALQGDFPDRHGFDNSIDLGEKPVGDQYLTIFCGGTQPRHQRLTAPIQSIGYKLIGSPREANQFFTFNAGILMGLPGYEAYPSDHRGAPVWHAKSVDGIDPLPHENA